MVTGNMGAGRSRAGTNYLTEKEEKILLSTIKGRRGKQAKRDYCLLRICLKTGLRKGEALALNVGDVRDKTYLIVDERIAEKGAIDSLKIKKPLSDIIQTFIQQKRKWGESIEDDAPLFVSKKDSRLARRTFNDLMTKWCAEAGIPRYTPHALRHTKAQRLIEKIQKEHPEWGHKIMIIVQKQLRHKSIVSTAIYTHATKEEMDWAAGI